MAGRPSGVGARKAAHASVASWSAAGVSRAHAFVVGSSRTVTATANSGYTFANWTENGNVVSSSASYNFTLNGINRWIGGVHQRGHHVPWRWNDATETITHA